MANQMTIHRPRAWPDKLRAAWLMIFLAALGQGSAFSSTNSAAPGASPENTVTALLEYQETSHGVANVSAFVAMQSAPFKKEPTPASGKVIRGHLNFGDNSSNAIPFLWQRDAGKLFLDLNHNRDLTDDPAGEFSAPLRRPLNDQNFTNVHLLFDSPSGKYPVLANINIWTSGSRTSCRLELRSFWQGKLTLPGQDWQVGVVLNDLGQAVACENDHLLLRPWEKRALPFNANDNSLDSFPFAQKLFFGGHAYQVNWVADPQNGEIKPALKFTEQSVALGELKITGQYIQRLTLPGGSYLVILDQPANTVKVPVGRYTQPNVLIEQAGAKAHCTVYQWDSGQRITVNDKAPAVLNAGGPLTNSVTATRQGRNLSLTYRLSGAGGATYQLANQDRSKPPEFAIFKGDQKVASGKFAFG
jgi:hypothetical protein